MPTKTSLKRSRYERNIWTEISSPKTFQEISLPKDISKTFYQGSSAETFSAQKLKRHLDQNVSQETFPYQKTWRKISTKKTSEEKSIPSKMKKHLHQKTWKKIIAKHMAKIRTDGIWCKNVFFYISSVSMFAIFRFKKTEVLLWRFLLKSFLVEISFWMGFLVEMPLQILFGRGLFWNLVG